MSFPPRIKICGMNSVSDAQCAAQAGADAIGLVFYPPSPRHITDLDLAADIARAVGPFVSVVGLFVDPEDAYIDRVLSSVDLHVVQFHGEEEEGRCLSYGRPYIKALRMKPMLNVCELIACYPSANGILLDAYQPGKPGGTGKSFDWQRIPDQHAKPIILAGGLNAENVSAAIKQAKPYAVDVSGGVEKSSGIKSAEKIKAFVQAVKVSSND